MLRERVNVQMLGTNKVKWEKTLEILQCTHGACRASLRLPKEKKYETRVFR